MKTIKEWFNELPDGYRERALNNQDEPKSKVKYHFMESALDSAFTWSISTEGHEFWDAVNDHYMFGTPLPPLPKTT